MGLVPGAVWAGQVGGGGFSCRADETAPGASVPALLVDVRCRSVGVRPAEVHAVDAAARSRDPAEEAATLLTVAVRGCLNDGGRTWLLVHAPVRADPEGTRARALGAGCSSGWGRTLVETCGLGACWEGWVLRGDLNDTTTGAEDLTERSVLGWGRRAVAAPGFLSGYSMAAVDAPGPSDEGTTVERRCPAVDPGDRLLVSGTEARPVDPALEREDRRLVRSCGHLLVTWSTCADRRTAGWSG